MENIKIVNNEIRELDKQTIDYRQAQFDKLKQQDWNFDITVKFHGTKENTHCLSISKQEFYYIKAYLTTK